MEAILLDWLTILVRWWHVLAGITWVGASFYFNWFDSLVRRTEEKTLRENNRGVLNEAHGGNFYYHEQYYPDQLPQGLHVHSWPSKMTFISGLLLLVLIYWLGASSYMIDKRVADISPMTAILISAFSIILCWLIYDTLCKKIEDNRIVLGVMACITFAAAYGFQQVYGGRAAYISVGVMLGSMMGLNVWRVIAPKSIHMQQQLRSGDGYNRDDGNQAKRRSQHNNYFTLPVVITMVSNHFATAYSHPYGWLILSLLMVAGWSVRYTLNLWYKHDRKDARFISLIVVVVVVAILLSLIQPSQPNLSAVKQSVTDNEMMAVMAKNCTVCHAVKPTQAGFIVAPQGLVLETPEMVIAAKEKIRQRVLVTRDMPLANLTQMTDEERALLAKWLEKH